MFFGVIITTLEPIFFQNLLSEFKMFLFVFFSFINTHHLFKNKSFFPCSGPLTSDPAIGWLEVQKIPFFNFF